MNMQEFFTWEYLATMAGCMAVTGLVTQFIKGWIDKLVHIPTQFLAYLVALVVLLAAQGFTGQLTLQMAGLDLLNAVLIASATSGRGFGKVSEQEIRALSPVDLPASSSGGNHTLVACHIC